ncbi:hypothetical protein QYE76_041173 [Lolium multiflorum]|uniref:Arabidopsis retrotransposon Orf1 C-terminal domain-containing protein n=1 Tax=Lolium multiflorum TaxID=4521 RepID=A0AAD8WTR1_LOLMU|nr:hypothetical protein QYE76_041173 [Lolium multiflorum]
MYRFMAKYKIKWNYSTGYYPQANGAIEAFNKTLGKILKKMVTRHRRDWHDRLFESLWAYRVTVRTPTQSTPYFLVYGSEVVLPLEVQLPSLRVAIQDELTKDEQVHLRFQELDALEEERLYALQNLELYRQNMVRAYDKLVKHRVFRKGELVLVLRRPIVVTHKTKGKFEPKWEGPYAIEQVYDGGAYQLVDSQGSRPMPPINGRGAVAAVATTAPLTQHVARRNHAVHTAEAPDQHPSLWLARQPAELPPSGAAAPASHLCTLTTDTSKTGSLGSFLDATIAKSRQIENTETPNAATPVNSPESVEYSSDDLDEDYVELDDDFIEKCNATTDARKIKKLLAEHAVRYKPSPDPKFATSPINIRDKDYDFSLDLSHIAIVEKTPFCGTEKESAVEHMTELSTLSGLFSDDIKMRTYFVAKIFPFSLKDDAKTWKRTPDDAEELLAKIGRNHDDWSTPEPTPTPIVKKRGMIKLNDEDMREAKKSLKEKGIKPEDVKNLPPIEDICEKIPPSSMIEYMKDIVTNKRKIPNEEISTMLANYSFNGKIPKKLGDPDKLIPTDISLQMADKSTAIPVGLCENVPVQVTQHCLILTDFVVLEMPEDDNMSIILGRPFLNTAGAVIDCNKGMVTFNVDDKEHTVYFPKRIDKKGKMKKFKFGELFKKATTSTGRPSRASTQIRRSYNEDVIAPSFAPEEDHGAPNASSFPCYEFLTNAGLLDDFFTLVNRAGLATYMGDERGQYYRLTKVFVESFKFHNTEYEPTVAFKIYDIPVTMKLEEFCFALGIAPVGTARRIDDNPRDLLELYRGITGDDCRTIQRGKIRNIQLPAIKYFAYYVGTSILGRENTSNISSYHLAFLNVALTGETPYHLGSLIARRLSSRGPIFGGTIASRILTHLDIPLDSNDVPLTPRKLDIAAMKSHHFVTTNSTIDNIVYKMLFADGNEKEIPLPQQGLFNIDRQSWSLTKEVVEEHMKIQEFHQQHDSENAEPSYDYTVTYPDVSSSTYMEPGRSSSYYEDTTSWGPWE